MPISLTSSERFQRRLRGEPVDRAPNFDIIMAFGAHHIGARLRDYYLDYRTLVRMNLAVLEDFQLDIVSVISDAYREACDWGLPVDFPEDNLPMRVRPLIEEPHDLRKLRPPDPETSRRMSDRIEGVRALKEATGGRVPVMGWVEGALAEANDLRGDTALLLDLYDRPEWLTDLLELLTETEISFARAQIAAGADIIGLGDAIASVISPNMYRTFALPYEQRIFQAVEAMGAVPRLHICGDTTRIAADMARSGAQIIDVDWMVNYAKTRAIFDQSPNRPSILGNADPVAVFYQGTQEEVFRATRKCLDAGGERCFIAAGCEIPDGTPPENIQAQNRAIQEFYLLPALPDER
jgi:MtaA/CmuA family methyltransferase